MGAPTKGGGRWLFGALVALVGVYFLVGGFLSGGPDAMSGVVFGGIFLLAGGVILLRRGRE